LDNHAPEPIRESEELFRAALDAMPDPISIHSAIRDETGRIVDFRVDFVNNANALVLGMSIEALTGRRLLELFPGMRDSGIFDAKVRVVETGEPNTIDSVVYDDSGAAAGPFEAVINTRTVKFGDGYIVSSVDFTARAQTEAAFRVSEGRYRTLVEESSDAIFVLDAGGRVIDTNTAGEQLLGYAPGELPGRPWDKMVTPDDLAAHPLHFTELREGSTLRFERVLRSADGKAIPVELGAKVLPDGRFLHVARDISVRKVAAEELVQSDARYRGLLEAAPDGMVVVNGAGEIVLLNLQAERQFGYHRDELIGQAVTNIIPEGFAERLIADDLRSTEAALAQVIGTGIELVALRKDGTTFPIEIMLSPLESAEGILVTAAIRDISVRKAAAEELVRKVEELNRSNEELGQFAYIASHDLQEPLRMVASYTQLLAKRYKGQLDSDADEFIAFAVGGANRMQRLIEDLMAYSRVGTRGTDLVKTSSEEALQQALINLRGSIEESDALVTHDPLPAVLADETQLIQLFQNLVGNALKYRSPGVPRVHIGAVRDREKRWSFAVTDNGIGMDPQYFDRIFGMFQRPHKREEYAGTGIGLTICKKIVERHGGSISVESQLGQGSTFRFSLAGSEMKS
jgi:PAS domain S-box-containing protein